MRKISLSAVVTALALAGALVGVGVAAAAHDAPRATGTVMVTPSTGLTNGQTVSVTASGYTNGETVFILQCQNPPTGQSSCNVGTAVSGTINGSGNLPATNFTVTTGIYGTTTCGTTSSDLSNCVIEVATITQSDNGDAPITFALSSSTTTTTSPSGTTTTTTPTTTTTVVSSTGRKVKATPSTNLHSGQRVTVTGSGFTPGDHVYVIECLRTATGQKGCDVATLKAVTVSSSGRLPSTAFKVVTGKIGNGRCGTSAATANKCDISVGNAAGKDAAKAPISFRR